MGTIQGLSVKILITLILINMAIGLSTVLHPEAYADEVVRGGLIMKNNTTDMVLNEMGTDLDAPDQNSGSFFSSIWDFFLLPVFNSFIYIFKILSGWNIVQTIEQFGINNLLGGAWPIFKYMLVSVSTFVFSLTIWTMISGGLNLGEDF